MTSPVSAHEVLTDVLNKLGPQLPQHIPMTGADLHLQRVILLGFASLGERLVEIYNDSKPLLERAVVALEQIGTQEIE